MKDSVVIIISMLSIIIIFISIIYAVYEPNHIDNDYEIVNATAIDSVFVLEAETFSAII